MPTRPGPALRPLPLVLAGLLGLLAAVPGEAEPDFKTAKARYEAYQERPSLYMRHRGRRLLAETHDLRALKILAKSYGHPEVPKDQVRYLLASLCGENFRAPPHVEAFRAWRKKNAKARDAWLWYRALDVESKNEGAAPLLEIARGRLDPFLRAAAVEALSAARDAEVLPLVTELLTPPPTRPLEHVLFAESAAEALHALRSKRTSDAWRAAAEAVVSLLDHEKTSERTKLVVARRLADICGVSALHRTAAPWRKLLEKEAVKVVINPDPAPKEKQKPRFMGITSTGSRIVYVIDLSDSMLTPLTGSEIEKLRKPPETPAEKKKKPRVRPRAPVTGDKGEETAPPEDDPPEEKKDEPPGGPEPPEDPEPEMPWSRIKTRFDAAREYLKLSLRRLDPEESFCVIFFGSTADLLRSTPGLVPATRANRNKAIDELNAIEPGPPERGRPFGTLKGYTNLHGGLHRAFKVTDRGLVKKDEYVDPKTFERGCDAIFVLSDGKPSWDDWPEMDTLEEEDDSGDPELRGKTEKRERGHFYGPYALSSSIRDDVRRLNLFRKVEIHCIGLGEYDPKLLDAIRKTGLGQLRVY